MSFAAGVAPGVNAFASQWHYLEETPHRVRAPEFIRLVRTGIGLSRGKTTRMNRLQPDSVASQTLEVCEAEAGPLAVRQSICQITKGSTLVRQCSSRDHGQGIDFVQLQAAYGGGRDNNGVIAFRIALAIRFGAVPMPGSGWIAVQTISRGEPVGSTAGRVQRQLVTSGDGIHLESFEVVVVVARDDVVSQRRFDAIFDPIVVSIFCGPVSPVQIREDFRRLDSQRLWIKENGNGHRIAGNFVHENVRGGVIGLQFTSRPCVRSG